MNPICPTCKGGRTIRLNDRPDRHGVMHPKYVKCPDCSGKPTKAQTNRMVTDALTECARKFSRGETERINMRIALRRYVNSYPVVNYDQAMENASILTGYHVQVLEDIYPYQPPAQGQLL